MPPKRHTPEMQAKFNARKSAYNNTWQADLMSTPFKDPLCCCTALFCPWCTSYTLRKRALHGDMARYLCCNGDCPCSGRMGEQSCPTFCLATEVACCFPQSVASTRWLLQDEMRIMNTQCDNCIIGTMIAMQYLSCLFSCAACITGNDALIELANVLDCIADSLYVSVCACMQTQHHRQIKARDEQKVGVTGAPQPFQAPHQQQIQVNQYPQAPPAGYPPQPGAGYPPAGAGYPPPGAGYPPPGAGYPPPGSYPPPGAAYPPAPGAYPPQHPGMQK